MVLRPSDLVTAISRRLSGGDVATAVFSNSLLLKRIGWLGLLRQESLFVGPRKIFFGMLRQIDVVGKAVGEPRDRLDSVGMGGGHKRHGLVADLSTIFGMIIEESENFDTLKSALRESLQRRGLATNFYVDNGACYRAGSLEQITAALGIQLIHSRPYAPQCRGKIERWFGYVREDFFTEARSF